MATSDFNSAGQLAQLEHDPDNHAKRVDNYLWNGGSGVWERAGVATPVYDKRLDDTTTLNMIYIGEAVPGTATSAATWRIKRLDVTVGLIIQWADSGDFTQVWDNRASLTYN